ncbi:MAG: hypothetical protein GY847_28210 [Proteobacteria bacterium]|nr:hypothetical protein [Pseudomonadota bacterium]
MHRPIYMSLWVVLVTGACQIDDEDRCLDGYRYTTTSKTCVPEDSDSDTGTETEPDTDTETSDGGSAEDGGEEFTGFGELCSNQQQCADYKADYCAIDPTSGEGHCTFKDCDATSCPESSTCCDCTKMGMPVFCIPDEVVAVAGAFCSCM